MQRRHELANIPTEVLRSFITILDTGSFTRAADALGLTQSAVSAQVKRLERLLGDKVFVKGTISLTARGEMVSSFARRLLSINDQILSGTTDGIRLGLPTLYGGKLLREIFKSCKDRTLQFHCDCVPNLRKRFEAGQLDVFLELSSNPPQEAEATWTEAACWASAVDFAPEPQAPFPFVRWPESPLDEIAMKALQWSSIRFVSAAITHDLNSHLQAVQAGLGYAVFAERALGPDMKLCEGLPHLPPMHVAVHVNPDIGNATVPVVNCLIGIVRAKGEGLRSPASGQNAS